MLSRMPRNGYIISRDIIPKILHIIFNIILTVIDIFTLYFLNYHFTTINTIIVLLSEMTVGTAKYLLSPMFSIGNQIKMPIAIIFQRNRTESY